MEPDAERKAALESEYMDIIRGYSHEQEPNYPLFSGTFLYIKIHKH
jgi:hypothetical protein